MLEFVSYFNRVFVLIMLLPGSLVMAQQADVSSSSKTVDEVIPITMANLRGQRALYQEGWFIVSSTDGAFRYARQKSITSSGQALTKMLTNLQQHSHELGRHVVTGVGKGVETGRELLGSGTERSEAIVGGTHRLARWQLATGQAGLVRAWDKFVLGNISLVQRTEDDRAALNAIPGDYFSSMKQDLSDLLVLTDEVASAVTPEIEVNWPASLQRAQDVFVEQYEASGEASNAIFGLFDIVSGYIKALYHAVFKPGGKAVAKGVTVTASVAGKLVFLPTASLFIVSGRTVQSAGLTLYYTTKAGIKLVSPTVESGLLAGVSLLSVGTVPLTYVGGTTAGLVNQVAMTTAAPVVGAAQAGASVVGESAKYAGLVTYDLLKGASTVVFNQTASGVALGYNALTALPAQALLGSANAAFFLVYDGPRLLVAKVSGELESASDDGDYAVADLPVGSVVDLKKLQDVPGVQLETVSEDPQVIEKVLQQMPKDLRQ